MISSSIIVYGLSEEKKRLGAVRFGDSNVEIQWLESLERCRKSFGLEGVSYEYWRYPSTHLEGEFWIKSRKKIAILLSEGFLKTATEAQVVAMMESLSTRRFHEVRRENRKKSIEFFFKAMKGEPRHYRYWFVSFFLYPFERFMRMAKI